MNFEKKPTKESELTEKEAKKTNFQRGIVGRSVDLNDGDAVLDWLNKNEDRFDELFEAKYEANPNSFDASLRAPESITEEFEEELYGSDKGGVIEEIPQAEPKPEVEEEEQRAA